MTLPRIGDVVHYVSYGTPGGEFPSVCRAAVVAAGFYDENEQPVVDLVVLNPNGQFFNETVNYAPYLDERGGTWHGRGECLS
jgi:hypothetical protein